MMMYVTCWLQVTLEQLGCLLISFAGCVYVTHVTVGVLLQCHVATMSTICNPGGVSNGAHLPPGVLAGIFEPSNCSELLVLWVNVQVSFAAENVPQLHAAYKICGYAGGCCKCCC